MSLDIYIYNTSRRTLHSSRGIASKQFANPGPVPPGDVQPDQAPDEGCTLQTPGTILRSQHTRDPAATNMFARSTIDPLALMLLSCAATNMSAASTFDLLARVLLSSADPLAKEIFRDRGFRAKFDVLFSRKRRAREDRIKYEERYRGSEKAFVAAGDALEKHCQSLFSEGESCCSLRDCLDAFSETLKQKNSVLEGYIRVLMEETRIQEDITDCVARFTEALHGAWDAQERERVEKLKRWRNDAIWLFVTILPFFLAVALSFLVRR